MAALSAAVGLWRTSSMLLTPRPVTAAAAAAVRLLSSGSGELLLPRTSLSQPPWDQQRQQQQRWESDLEPSVAGEQRGRHAAVVSTVNRLIQQRDRELGRLFAVVQLAGRQWKVTAEDLILIENHIQAGCGERIRLEKVLLVGAEEFTLLGRPLLGKQLVRVEATVLEKTQSWPKVHMRFWKRHRSERKKIIVQPQTVLRVNSIQLAPTLT